MGCWGLLGWLLLEWSRKFPTFSTGKWNLNPKSRSWQSSCQTSEEYLRWGVIFLKTQLGTPILRSKFWGTQWLDLTWPIHTYTHIYIYIDKDFSTANGYKGLCCENKENSENQDHQGCERQKYNQPSFHLRIHVTKSLMMPFVVWTCLVIFGKCDGFPGTKQTYNIVSYRLTPGHPSCKGGGI